MEVRGSRLPPDPRQLSFCDSCLPHMSLAWPSDSTPNRDFILYVFYFFPTLHSTFSFHAAFQKTNPIFTNLRLSKFHLQFSVPTFMGLEAGVTEELGLSSSKGHQSEQDICPTIQELADCRKDGPLSLEIM